MNKQPEIELTHEYKIYFIAESNNTMVNDEKLSEESNVSLAFDYVRDLNDPEICTLYIDIEILAPHFAKILYRCEYLVKGAFDSLLNPELLFTVIDKSFEQTEVSFNQMCLESGVQEVPTFILQETDYDKIIEGIIHEIPVREKTWEGNKELHLAEGGFFSMGKNTSLFMQGTFVVIDQLFMLNPHVDHMHNRHVFFEQTGLDLSRYNTLKIYCSTISQHDIRLSFYQLIYLFLLVDCAAQILISPLQTIFEAELMHYGLSQERTNDYLKVASEIRGQLNHELTAAGTIIDLLNKSYDWPALMR